MKKKIPIYPTWICHPCGVKHGNRTVGMATWHENTCDICGDTTEVTEPRDFGHLKDTWIKAAESRSDEQQNCYPYVEIQGNTIAELSSRNDQLNKELAAVTKQRDGLKQAVDCASDLLASVTEQRDRLAEAVNAAAILIAAKGRHNTMLAYNGLRDALQSLTTNEL